MDDAESIVAKAQAASQRLLGLRVERSKLEFYSEKEWHKVRGDSNAVGLYFSGDFRATVCKDYPRYRGTILHELFGHGLFYEHSCRISDRTFALVEGVATWTESILAPFVGTQDEWNRFAKYGPKDYLGAYRRMAQIHEGYGHLGVMCEAGWPAYFTEENTLALLDALYSKRVPLALCSGKGRLVVVSPKPRRRDPPRNVEIEEICERSFIDRLSRKDSALIKALEDSPALVGMEKQDKILGAISKRTLA